MTLWFWTLLFAENTNLSHVARLLLEKHYRILLYGKWCDLLLNCFKHLVIHLCSVSCTYGLFFFSVWLLASFEIDSHFCLIYHQLLFDTTGSEVSRLKCVTWPNFSEESEQCSTVISTHLPASSSSFA